MGKYAKRGLSVLAALSLSAAMIPETYAAGEDEEIVRLKAELQGLKQRHHQATQAMSIMEKRLQNLEGNGQADQKTGKSQAAESHGKSGPSENKTGKPTVVQKSPPVQKEPTPSLAVQDILEGETGFFNGSAVLELGVTYAHFDRSLLNLSGFLALDAIFLGNLSIDDVESDIVTAGITGRYGLTDDLQIDANVPFLYRNSTFTSGGVGGASQALSDQSVTLNPDLADVSFGYTYRLLKETSAWPDVVWNVRVKAPTGTDPFGIETETDPTNDNLIVPKELPSGNGVWTVSSGLSFVRTLDPAVLFASVDYFYNLKESFNDIASGDGDQAGTVDLGDSIQYGFGMAFALNENMSLSLGYSQRFTMKTAVKPQGGQWNKVVSSDTNIAQIDFGLTYAITPNLSMITNVGAGLTEDAPDVVVGLKFPYAFD